MKKRKIIKSVSVVALSSILAVGTVGVLSACGGGGGDPGSLSISVFCNASDEKTNKEIIQKWEESYIAAHPDLGLQKGFAADNFSAVTVKETYFTNLQNGFNSGLDSVADIIYMAPRSVKLYAKLGRVMDLTGYLTEADKEAVSGVWSNAISFYGYDKTDNKYTFGQNISYNVSAGKFQTKAGKDVGLYGLPKDYSNFSLGYNRYYFTNDLMLAYQEHKGSDGRNVKNPAEQKKAETFTGTTGTPVAKYATSGKHYVYNADGTVKSEEDVTKGQEAPLIAIGIPVTYKPFNYYRYNSYDQALENNDAIAMLVDSLTGGEGYTVTIPGFPGQTFNVSDAESSTNAVNADAPYDSSIGHITYTYQEYSALSWAVSYYLNTFDWDAENPLSGTGGITVKVNGEDVNSTIYAGEQYEYAQGCELYLLPWLAANDADFLDQLATTTINPTGIQDITALKGRATEKAYSLGGTTTETRSKVNLDGTSRDVAVQYGINSQKFLETYAAYENHGAIWNANAGPAKDRGNDSSGKTGWDYFRQGRAIFYGAGSWDPATRNDADPTYFACGTMPTPVAESYALYSKTNTPDYDKKTMVEYSNGATKGTGNTAANDAAQRANKADGCKSYTRAEVLTNQLLRQDKWAARMDSVGFAVNGRLGELAEGDPEYWKAEAAASLIVALTADRDAQITLNYGGAQLPNFVDQCEDWLYYNNETYNNALGRENAFKGMVTPDDANWNDYYTVARKMADDSLVSSKKSMTVSAWMAANASTYAYNSEKYGTMTLGEFTGEMGKNISTAMKILRMVNFTYGDRDLNLRMQSGLNGVRDSAMYTPDDEWLMGLNAATFTTNMFTYNNTAELPDIAAALKRNDTAIARTYAQYAGTNGETKRTWWSPAMYALYTSLSCNTSLKAIIEEENESLGGI